MLQVDDVIYSESDLEKYYEKFDSITIFKETNDNIKQLVIAICLQDTFTWLALCFYLKSKNITVMPIHSNTPIAAAKRLAYSAGCDSLFFGDMNNVIELVKEENVELQVKKINSQNLDTASGLIQMSSGTTGNPKCILRSWQSIDEEVASYIKSFEKPNSMTPVIACPTTHSYGLISGVLVAIARKKVPIIITTINPKYLIKRLLKCEHPLLYASPILLRGLMRLWPKNSQLYAAMTSGSMMSQAVFEELRPKITQLFQQYGCSEAGCISINQNMVCTDAIGTPLPHLKVAAGNSVDQLAEIVVSSFSEAPDTDQHLIHTQDLGYLDTDQQPPMLHFISRQDDTIIVAGLNVYPQQVEDIILTHPDIIDAVIFKIDDVYAGQRVCLHYVSDPSKQPKEAHEIRAWCQEYMATYQVPQQLLAVNSIERMANGKINRKQLAELEFKKKENAINTTRKLELESSNECHQRDPSRTASTKPSNTTIN